MTEPTRNESPPGPVWIKSALACGLIGTVTFAGIWIIRATEPEAERGGATRRAAAIVETITVERGTWRPVITALGTVDPAREIQLAPQVGGRIVEVADAFSPGEFARAGDVLVRIEPADYSNQTAIRRAEVEEARASLEIEKGRKAVAEEEFALLGDTIDAANRALVLREPQINAAIARLNAAEAALRQAELDLERTAVRAPFDAMIIERSANLGSRVSAGMPIARLVDTQTWWLTATIPLKQLSSLEFAENKSPGATVRVHHHGVWPEGTFRTGQLLRLVGTVDEQTRLARIIIELPDPNTSDEERPPLVLGTILEAQIEGKPLPNTIRLERRYLRKNGTVWINEGGLLSIRTPEIIASDANSVYINSGLEAGDAVIVSSLATVAPGIPLQTVTTTPTTDTPEVP